MTKNQFNLVIKTSLIQFLALLDNSLMEVNEVKHDPTSKTCLNKINQFKSRKICIHKTCQESLAFASFKEGNAFTTLQLNKPCFKWIKKYFFQIET